MLKYDVWIRCGRHMIGLLPSLTPFFFQASYAQHCRVFGVGSRWENKCCHAWSKKIAHITGVHSDCLRAPGRFRSLLAPIPLGRGRISCSAALQYGSVHGVNGTHREALLSLPIKCACCTQLYSGSAYLRKGRMRFSVGVCGERGDLWWKR